MRRSSRGDTSKVATKLWSRYPNSVRGWVSSPDCTPFFVQFLLFLFRSFIWLFIFFLEDTINMHINTTVTTSPPGYMQPWGTTQVLMVVTCEIL